MQQQLDGAVPLVTVGFSPPAALDALADHLGLTGTVLSDPDRDLYRLLGLGRAPVWQVYSPGTLLHYARAVARGRRLQKPVEDTRQLGGDALVVDGVVRRIWRPRTPDDRADPRVIAAGARAIGGGAA
ncbi:AhpC/TSA family protein [Pseudonocardia nigra]|uniref:AhpC/TSA family protein n=1 Tax=Pseudonocardia nigra TaxID=1921578 RepID=UPI001C5D06DC|nr:AhpC/TSA family protein [Pseudonocardia nigra]